MKARLLILAVILVSAVSAVAEIPDDLLNSLSYRLVGPFRGGRVTAVAGVPGDPMTYYMGGTGGGVWKTENAGTTWENISDDHFNVGTIGAIAAATRTKNQRDTHRRHGSAKPSHHSTIRA